jgi:hypothetical protein
MRRPLVIYDFATDPFLIYVENLIFFISVERKEFVLGLADCLVVGAADGFPHCPILAGLHHGLLAHVHHLLAHLKNKCIILANI